MKIYESSFLVLEFFEPYAMLHFTWSPRTDQMTDIEFKEEFLKYQSVVIQYKIKKILVDAVHQKYIIAPSMQDWINTEIFPSLLASGLRKVAILIADDLISQVSNEQAMEEDTGLKFDTKFFENKDFAMNWLLKD